MTEEARYVIRWQDRMDGFMAQGSYTMTYEAGQIAVAEANRELPEVHHWLVPVEDKLEQAAEAKEGGR